MNNLTVKNLTRQRALLTVIALGGPGSGCTGPNCGRPKGSGYGEGSVAKELHTRLQKSGGFTYKPATKRTPHVGFAVSLSPENERILSKGSVTPQKIREVLREYASALKSDPRAHVGGWMDPESGKVFLDVSVVVRDRNEAISLGKQYNQLAIFDLKAGQTVSTGIERVLVELAEADAPKLIRFDFDNDATEEEIIEFIMSLQQIEET